MNKTQPSNLYASYQQDLFSTHETVDHVVRNFLRFIQCGPTYTSCICIEYSTGTPSNVKLMNTKTKLQDCL